MGRFQIEGMDLIAISMIVVCGILLMAGKNGVIQSILVTIVAYYFGAKVGRKK